MKIGKEFMQWDTGKQEKGFYMVGALIWCKLSVIDFNGLLYTPNRRWITGSENEP